MPYLKPSGYKIPKEVVEHTPDIKKKEAVFTKKKGPFSKFKQIGFDRKKNWIDYFPSDIKDRLYHTHIQSKDWKVYFICTPSIIDLISYYTERKTNNIPIQGIFVIDEKTGKNIGRTFYMFTDKTDKIIDDLYKRYKKVVSKKESDPFIKNLLLNCDEDTKKLLESNTDTDVFQKKQILFQLLLEQKTNQNTNVVLSKKEYYDILTKDLGIKIRFVSMPGYKFNKEKFIFEKK
ncbi:MAG TPA: hypothetical protein PKK56_02545 [archaeon]|nr:hypothetical protein [archaeon]HRT03714.1 hypothetical protein [Candidatus Diapherotrites archaeon]